MYGEGATESAIEHRLRTPRRTAAEMRENAPAATSNATVTPQSRRRTARALMSDDTAETPTPAPRSDRKRSTKKGGAAKKPAKSTGNARQAPIPIEDSDEGKENNSRTKRVKRETTPPALRNELPDLNAGRTAFFDSSLNGYDPAFYEAFAYVPELEESWLFYDHNTMGGHHNFGYDDEC